jgi:hypothetical protein
MPARSAAAQQIASKKICEQKIYRRPLGGGQRHRKISKDQ